jgi:hypothetical protein
VEVQFAASVFGKLKPLVAKSLWCFVHYCFVFCFFVFSLWDQFGVWICRFEIRNHMCAVENLWYSSFPV